MSITEIAQTIAVMRMKEESTYSCINYFPSTKSANPEGVDEECRIKMVQWCFQVVEFCNFNREVVGIGMSYLDRFLCTSQGENALKDRKVYQLASMCSLYMATKLFETREMDLRLLSQLSRGVYSEVEIATMESSMLNALKWLVHPPTAVSFINECLRAVPFPTMDGQTFDAIISIARSQTELAVVDDSFITTKQSSIALASIVNAMNILETIPRSVRSIILDHISQVTEIDINCLDILRAREMLQVSWEKSIQPILLKVFNESHESSGYGSEAPERGSMSPVCVSNRSQ